MLSDLEFSSGSHPHRCDHTQDVDAEPAGTESAEARRGSGGRSSSLQPRFRCQVQIYISIGTSTTDINILYISTYTLCSGYSLYSSTPDK